MSRTRRKGKREAGALNTRKAYRSPARKDVLNGRLVRVRKAVRWFGNAARRTAVAFLPALATPDDRFAREWLERNEFEPVRQMDPRDRLHGIPVPRRLLELQPQASGTVVTAALLHDVGTGSQANTPAYRV